MAAARRRAHVAEDAESFVSVYAGTVCIGHIAQRGREHVALSWPNEVDLGTYPTRKAAADAVSAAASWAAPRPGGRHERSAIPSHRPA
jgi:hypothetical protein